MSDRPPLPATYVDPGDELARRDELEGRLRWIINLRWIALVCVFIAVSLTWLFSFIVSPWPLWIVNVVMAVLNLGFHGLHLKPVERSFRALTAEALLQIAVDIVGLGLLICFAGGLSNPFIFFLTFHVVIASILLDRRKANGVALLTIGVVALLALAEQNAWLAEWPLRSDLAIQHPTALARLGMVFVIATTLMFSAYFTTHIMEHLRSQSHDVRRLNADLAERVELLARTERKLKAEHQRARAILECMEEGVIVVDLSGKVLLANSAAREHALATMADTFKRAGVEVVHPGGHKPGEKDCDVKPGERHDEEDCNEDNAQDCLHDALEHGGELCESVLALLSGGGPPKRALPQLTPPTAPTRVDVEHGGRIFENTVSPVTGDSGEGMGLGMVVVARDVTERRSLERQVLHAEKLNAMGSLAAGVAHELNTPLGTILGYAQMLLDDPASPTAPKDLKAIEEQARRCRKAVQGMLDFARKSGGERRAADADQLVHKACELAERALKMRGIDLVRHAAASSLPVVAVQTNEIEQVLVNLITNAADALDEMNPEALKTRGGGRIDVRTQPADDGGVRISVEDNGPGIRAEQARRIFEPFFTTKEAGKGTGLGLSIAARVIEDHGGTLQLLPRDDGQGGCRFEIKLPTVSEQTSPSGEPQTDGAPDTVDHAGATAAK